MNTIFVIALILAIIDVVLFIVTKHRIDTMDDIYQDDIAKVNCLLAIEVVFGIISGIFASHNSDCSWIIGYVVIAEIICGSILFSTLFMNTTDKFSFGLSRFSNALQSIICMVALAIVGVPMITNMDSQASASAATSTETADEENPYWLVEQLESEINLGGNQYCTRITVGDYDFIFSCREVGLDYMADSVNDDYLYVYAFKYGKLVGTDTVWCKGVRSRDILPTEGEMLDYGAFDIVRCGDFIYEVGPIDCYDFDRLTCVMCCTINTKFKDNALLVYGNNYSYSVDLSTGKLTEITASYAGDGTSYTKTYPDDASIFSCQYM